MHSLMNSEVLASLLLSVLLGAVVGVERELTHKPAGLRTHMLVSLGSCLFTLISISFSVDPARIAAGIVTGIGFIGAGTILAERERVVGITTAASLWVTAAIGLTAGIGDYLLASTVTVLVLFILFSKMILKKIGL
jgi:putative Mg2+ transporter-C (MgtC) family protein